MKKQIHVVGAVIVRDGRILCAQRGADQSLPLKWEFPGGKIEPGETPQAALLREIQEEMNCTVEIGEQVVYTAHEYDFGVVHLTTFYCKLRAGTPTLTEHANLLWLPPHELNTLEWAPADIPAIEHIMGQSRTNK